MYITGIHTHTEYKLKPRLPDTSVSCQGRARHFLRWPLQRGASKEFPQSARQCYSKGEHKSVFCICFRHLPADHKMSICNRKWGKNMHNNIIMSMVDLLRAVYFVLFLCLLLSCSDVQIQFLLLSRFVLSFIISVIRFSPFHMARHLFGSVALAPLKRILINCVMSRLEAAASSLNAWCRLTCQTLNTVRV